jgi:hypothetical protein
LAPADGQSFSKAAAFRASRLLVPLGPAHQGFHALLHIQIARQQSGDDFRDRHFDAGISGAHRQRGGGGDAFGNTFAPGQDGGQRYVATKLEAERKIAA